MPLGEALVAHRYNAMALPEHFPLANTSLISMNLEFFLDRL